MCMNVMFILYFIHFHGQFHAPVITHRPLTAEVRIRSQASQCEFYGEQSVSEAGFIPTVLRTLISLNCL